MGKRYMTKAYLLMPLLLLFIGTTIVESLQERSADTCQSSSHLYVVNGYKYCKCCPPGYYKKADCAVTGTEAVCMPCEANEYSNTYNQAIRCAPCQKPALCNKPNAFILQSCNGTSNFVCICEDGYHLVRRSGSDGDGECVKHSTCGPGQFVITNGTLKRDTQCQDCPSETFSTSYDLSSSCKNCSTCPPSIKPSRMCNSTSDAICSPREEHKVYEEGPDYKKILPIALPTVVVVVVCVTAVILLILRRNGVLSTPSGWLFTRTPLGGDLEKDPAMAKEVQTCVVVHNIPYEELNAPSPYPLLDRSPVDGTFRFACTESPGSRHHLHVAPNCLPYNINQLQTNRSDERTNAGTTLSGDEVVKRWKECFRWLSGQIVKDWKHVFRDLFSQYSCTERSADNIIDEVLVNHHGDVKEQIYQAMNSWYKTIGPKHADLKFVCVALDNVGCCEISKILKEEFRELKKEEKEETQTSDSPLDRTNDLSLGQKDVNKQNMAWGSC